MVILDITGVPVVDSSVAATLVRTASALGLLGAEVVISGIRPEVAETLVRLEVDLRALATKGALRQGIAYAFRKTGEAP